METKDKLQQTVMDINKKQLEPKGYYVDCVVLTDSPSTSVYKLCLTRVSTQQKVSMTAFLDNPQGVKEETLACIQELMTIMGIN